MVRCAPKPSFLEASCCSVEVVKGAVALRFLCFFSTSITSSARAPSPEAPVAEPMVRAWASSMSRTSLACSPFVTVNCLTLSSPSRERRAVKGWASFSSSALTLQYSLGTKASISSSRSQIILSAGVCTRPAESPALIFRQSSGERLNPTR